jgi:DNA-binding XRE family transcriptional regulator
VHSTALFTILFIQFRNHNPKRALLCTLLRNNAGIAIFAQKEQYMHLGGIIKERRKNLRITQDTLADISGIGLRTVKQLELGKGNPTLDTLDRIASVLGMELILQVKSIDRHS